MRASINSFDMAPVLGFDDDIEFGALDRGVVKQPLMVDLDDVAGMLADDPRDPRQRSRHIGQFGAQPHQSAFAHQPAHQDRGKQPAVDVAAADDDRDPFAGKALGRGEHRRHPAGAGPFGDQLLPFEQSLERTFEHRFIDQQDVGDECLDNASRQPPRLFDRDPFGQASSARPVDLGPCRASTDTSMDRVSTGRR